MTAKGKRILEWTLIGIVALCALLLAVMLSYQQVYAGKIYRNVHFGTIDLSGKSKGQAEQILAKQFETLTQQDFTISSGDKELKAKIEDTGLSFDSKEIIDNIYNAGRNNGFWSHLMSSSKTLIEKTVIDAQPKINETNYNSFVDITVKQLNSEPIDASLSIASGEIKSVESKDGQMVDTSKLVDQIISLITMDPKKVVLAANITAPKIKSADFEIAKQQAEALLNKKIIFSYDGKTYQPTKTELGAWIVFANKDSKYSANFDDSNVKAYLNKIAQKFEVGKVDSKVASSGEVLQPGKDGLYLDKDNALSSLKSQIAQPQIGVTLVTIAEQFKQITVNFTDGVETGRYEGKYIDINLTTQRFCRVDGANLVDCMMTSTGKPSMPTPTGEFKVLNKIPMAFSSIYHLWMPWWQQINGPIGIHELVVFPGGVHEDVSHMGQKISHGCIRLAPGNAEMLYNWTELGTPVYVHK